MKTPLVIEVAETTNEYTAKYTNDLYTNATEEKPLSNPKEHERRYMKHHISSIAAIKGERNQDRKEARIWAS
jgi:hypothetical protein